MILPRTTPKTWNIYFVKGVDSGRIYIAKTGRDPETAVNSLNVGEECVLIKSILGTVHLRQQLHDEFKHLAIQHNKNWYKSDPSLTIPSPKNT